MDDPTRSFADINGLRLYHEIHGSGRPVVLLHGGLQTVDLMFGPLLPALAARRQLIAVELQGHGHTADTDRAMSIDQLADDVAALLAHLGIDEADIFGFSLGGLVGWSLVIAKLLAARLNVELDPRGVGRPAEHVTTPSAAASVGRWRRDLSSADADELKPAAERLGY